jgi:phage terminase small subunit
MPGRPRKPKKIHELQGTAQKCRMESRAGELELPVESPVPPSFLSPVALEEWNRVCALGGYAKVLNPVDRGPLTLYCVLWAELVQSQDTGEPMQTSRMALYSNLAGKFGMNPSERTKVHMPEQKKPANKFAALKLIKSGTDK